MEVLDARECPLANYEVLQFLREEKEADKEQGKKKKFWKTPQLATLRLETLAVLEATPAKRQDDEIMKDFIEEIEKFKVISQI